MRKPLQLLALTLALVALGSLTAVSASAGLQGPRLFVLSSHPLTIQGRHFKPHAQVRVTLSSLVKTTKRVTVKSSGRFTVSFPGAVDRCTQWTVRATQPGRGPVLVRGPKPQCAPA